MKLFFRLAPGIFLFCWVAVTLEPRALAYVDPGSSLMITQTAGAVVTAVAFWFRRQIRGFIARYRSAAKKTEL